MITLYNNEKRWLEIIFYLLCNTIYSINNNQKDIINFIQGFRWTNMFDYDTLIKAIKDEKILLNPNIIPSKHEFLIAVEHPECRLRIAPRAIRILTKGTNYKYFRKHIFHAQMKEEIHKTELFPKMTTKNIHETIYSFLIAIRYIADIVKTIKF